MLCAPRRGGRLSGIRTEVHTRALLRPAVSGAEQIPDLTRRHSRRTFCPRRPTHLHCPVSGWKCRSQSVRAHGRHHLQGPLLHLLRALPVPLPESIPYLGVDEFAVRRGRTYATILVDTNTHHPIDVLADRTAHTSAAWLREHPEVRNVSRDRAGAPQARQVTQAWHLLHNLAEAVGRVVGRHRAALREPPHGPDRPGRHPPAGGHPPPPWVNSTCTDGRRPWSPAPASATSRSTNASNAATACEPSPVDSTSAAAPSCASPGPPMPSS